MNESISGPEPDSLPDSLPEPIPAETTHLPESAIDDAAAPAKVVEAAPEPVAAASDPAVGDAAVLAASRRHTRRSFAAAVLSAAAGYGIYRWIEGGPIPARQSPALRGAMQAEEALSKALFDDRALAPTYPMSRAEKPRTNGYIGLDEELATESWRLQLVGVADAKSHPQYVPDVTAWEYEYTKPRDAEKDKPHEVRAGAFPRGTAEAGLSASTLPSGTPGLLLTLADVVRFPRHELVTEFKCVEGWSQIIHWSGVRMADFLEAYPPARNPDGSEPRYVYMETPDGNYYVGYDLHVCRHPQTLLVTEMAGEPLTQVHGAPLRLHTPAKYGYKQIKRIGVIAYSNVKPDDYWTKLGYDWYAGL
jgi:hypothetical protein